MDFTDAELRLRNLCNTADEECNVLCDSVPLLESDGNLLRHVYSDSMLLQASSRCQYRSIERLPTIEDAAIGSRAESIRTPVNASHSVCKRRERDTISLVR